MTREDFTWMTGGQQGIGVDSSANIFARACCYGGLHVYGKREYHSNIKGLHSYFHVRVSPKEVRADVNRVDLLRTFDAETVVRHALKVPPDGGIVCDAEGLRTRICDIPTSSSSDIAEFQKTMDERGVKPETVGDLLNEVEKKGVRIYLMPYMDLPKRIAREIGEEKLSRLTRMINILALGASFGLIKYDKAYVEKAIKMVFADKPRIISMNILALSRAYDYATQNFDYFGFNLRAIQTDEERIFLQGTQAIALGKVSKTNLRDLNHRRTGVFKSCVGWGVDWDVWRKRDDIESGA